MTSSPTQRTLKLFRDDDYHCAVVEHHFKPAGVQFGWKRDLFGFADIIAIKPGEIILIQCTSGSNHSKRKDKIIGWGIEYIQDPKERVRAYEATEGARKWIAAGGRILVVSWAKKVAKNKDGSKAKQKRWTPRVEEIFKEDFVEIAKRGNRGLVGHCERVEHIDPEPGPEFCLESLSLKTD